LVCETLTVAFSPLAAQFPRVAAELARFSGADLTELTRRVVEEALTATGVQVTDRSSLAVERLVWSLDDEAWRLQEETQAGKTSGVVYDRAFRRARAANGLLDAMEDRYDSAVYEACHALGADEDGLLDLMRRLL
jgi:hypothetical protein